MKTVCLFLFVGVLSSIAYGKYGEDSEWPEDIPGDVNRRIVGGRPAMFGEFPYQVALRPVGSNDTSFYYAFCGGSIIDHHWVLTAAHCFWDKTGLTEKEEEIEVIPGGVPLISWRARRVALPVEKIIVHKDYDPNTSKNDIALLKVAGDLLAPRAGVTREAIPLAKPEQRDDFVGQPADVTGYGHTVNNAAKSSRYLMYTMIRIYPDKKCHSGWFGFPYLNYDKDVMICAGVLEGGQDSCQGDSGGPLVSIDKNSRRVQVGVVSYGGKCGAKKPAVYARVSEFYNDIQDVLSGKITEGKKKSASFVSGLLHKLVKDKQ